MRDEGSRGQRSRPDFRCTLEITQYLLYQAGEMEVVKNKKRKSGEGEGETQQPPSKKKTTDDSGIYIIQSYMYIYTRTEKYTHTRSLILLSGRLAGN